MYSAGQLITLLQEVESHIPAFRAIFWPHDNPALLTDWELKQSALDAAKAGKCSSDSQVVSAPSIDETHRYRLIHPAAEQTRLAVRLLTVFKGMGEYHQLRDT